METEKEGEGEALEWDWSGRVFGYKLISDSGFFTTINILGPSFSICKFNVLSVFLQGHIPFTGRHDR